MNDSSKTSHPEPAILKLDPVCAIGNAADLKQVLLEVLDDPQPVTIDVSSLERVDTTGLQLLYAFMRDRARRGGTVVWQGTEGVFQDAVKVLGVPLGLLDSP
jgi:anti-anti-sigma regulatory factor